MVDTGQDEGFKVTDRRRRDDATEGVSSAAPVREPVPEPSGASGEERPGSQPVPDPTQVHDDQSRDLTDLFMMLASSAVVALGDAADPLTGEMRSEPAHAAETIDLLMLLKDKTEGNRTAEESQLLDAIIYDLQVRYINAMKRS